MHGMLEKILIIMEVNIMKQFRIRFRDNFWSTEDKFIIIIAETPQDVNECFLDRHSGIIMETEFIGWL